MYLTRLIDRVIEEKLKYIGAISIEGPKWCGKSTTAARFAKTIVHLQDPITFMRYSIYASTSVDELLRGEKPLMFDEWQKIPDLWDFIRLQIDLSEGTPGQFILIGSSRPMDDNQRHSGAGRIAKIRMYPLSLHESMVSTGEVSLNDLFNSSRASIHGESKLSISNQIDLICKGGWPGLHDLPMAQATNYLRDYYEALITTDIVDIDGVRRNPKRAKAILRAYARNISTLTSFQTLLKDLENSGSGMDKNTLDSYLRALEKLYVIADIPAWTPRLRSATTARMSAKRQFIDPSIAIIALGAAPTDLEKDMETLGFFFESLVARDLRIYSESLGGELFHYRDSSDLEVDYVIRLPDGRWGAIEVKLGGSQLDYAATNLIKLSQRVDSERFPPPTFKMIIYAGQHAYCRPDGVYVVPLGCLKD